MAENIPLSHIPLGKRVVIASAGDNERLKALGFRADTEIIPIHTAAGGDPRAYYVVGAVIAIRQGEADNIGVRERTEDTGKGIITENNTDNNKKAHNILDSRRSDNYALKNNRPFVGSRTAADIKTDSTSVNKNLYKRGEAYE